MAKKKISGLPAGSALNGTELVPIVQTGTTKRITTQDIANLGNASGVEGSGTINRLAKFTASSTIGNSQLFDDGTSVGLGTITPLGLLHLFKASATTRLVMDGNPAQSKIITYRTNGVQRFGLYVNNTAESGGNAGSDFAFRAYDDAGTLLNTPLFIKRSTGAVTFASGLGIGGATASTSGIQFPATQVASANNNNLDDYEEGTWTMGLSFGGGTTGIAYTSNTGNYVKIGKQVTVTGFIAMTNKGSSTGSAKITGLPFTVAAATANYSAPSFWTDAITFTVSLQGYGNVSGTTIDMLQVSALGIGSTLTDTNFANNSRLMVTLTYFV
jgi:hypothetical protein